MKLRFEPWTKNVYLRNALRKAGVMLLICIVFMIGVYRVVFVKNKNVVVQLKSFATKRLDETDWVTPPAHALNVRKKSILEYARVDHITGFSYAELLPHDRVELHSHQSKDEVFHVVEGDGTVTIRNGDLERVLHIETGTTVVLYAKEKHSFLSGDNGLKMLYFGVF